MSHGFCQIGRLAIVIVALIMACATQRQVSQFEIDHTLLRADTLLTRDQPDSAAALINELVRAVPKDTVLLWRQAVVNSQLESVEGRRKAARALRGLSELSPNDPRYHLCLAKILIDQTRGGDARRELYRAIDLAPADEEAYLILADQYLKPFFTKDEGDRADSAEQVLTRLITNNPKAVAGLSKLGGVEAVRGKIETARVHVKTLLAIDSNTVEANLVMGYIDYQVKDFAGAERFFARALAQMDSTETAGYRSIEYLIPPASMRPYGKMSAQVRDSLEHKFWSMADLDPTTPANERRVEHYARVWEANLCYSDPKNERIGWKTDMGETLIRLGRPDDKVRVRMGGSLVDATPVWFWQYRSVAYPCTLAFVDQMQSGNYTFPFPQRDNTGSFRSNASKEIAFLNYIRKPEESTLARERRPIGLATDVYQFRGDGGAAAVLEYLAISTKGISLGRDPGSDSLEIRQATHDSTQTAIWSRDTAFVPAPSSGRDTIHTTMGFPHQAGKYELSIAVEQTKQNCFGLARDTILVEKFPDDTIGISDLVLTADSVMEPSLGSFWRGSREETPRPGHVFSGSKPVYLYFEIYNLPTDIYRQTSYELSYTLQLVKPTESGMRSLMSKVLPRKKESISVSLHEVGKSRDLVRVLALGVSELREGSYNLTMQLTDLIFNRTVSKTTELLLVP
jgi:GWxTD domain-containing protein